MKEDRESWRSFFVWLKECGLTGVQLIIDDKNLGMLETIPEVFPDARYQRCTVHFYRNIFSVTYRLPNGRILILRKTIDTIVNSVKIFFSRINFRGSYDLSKSQLPLFWAIYFSIVPYFCVLFAITSPT